MEQVSIKFILQFIKNRKKSKEKKWIILEMDDKAIQRRKT